MPSRRRQTWAAAARSTWLSGEVGHAVAARSEEQRDRISRLADRRARRDRQRRHRVDDLAGHVQRRPAGGQHRRSRATRQQPLGRGVRPGEHVLGVVEHDGERRRSPMCSQSRSVPASNRTDRRHTEHAGHRRRHPLPSCTRRQLDEPRRRRRGRRRRRRLEGEAGLADAPDAGQRDQAVRLQQRGDLRQLDGTAHEAGEIEREVVQGAPAGRPATTGRRPAHARADRPRVRPSTPSSVDSRAAKVTTGRQGLGRRPTRSQAPRQLRQVNRSRSGWARTSRRASARTSAWRSHASSASSQASVASRRASVRRAASASSARHPCASAERRTTPQPERDAQRVSGGGRPTACSVRGHASPTSEANRALSSPSGPTSRR